MILDERIRCSPKFYNLLKPRICKDKKKAEILSKAYGGKYFVSFKDATDWLSDIIEEPLKYGKKK